MQEYRHEMRAVLVWALFAASCSGGRGSESDDDPTDVGGAYFGNTDARSVNLSPSDVEVADAEVADVEVADVEVADVEVADVEVADVGSADLGALDLGAAPSLCPRPDGENAWFALLSPLRHGSDGEAWLDLIPRSDGWVEVTFDFVVEGDITDGFIRVALHPALVAGLVVGVGPYRSVLTAPRAPGMGWTLMLRDEGSGSLVLFLADAPASMVLLPCDPTPQPNPWAMDVTDIFGLGAGRTCGLAAHECGRQESLSIVLTPAEGQSVEAFPQTVTRLVLDGEDFLARVSAATRVTEATCPDAPPDWVTLAVAPWPPAP